MKTVRAYLSKGVFACQKGFERAVVEAKTPLRSKNFWRTRTDA
jgi:hypothetical protein